MAIKPDDFCLVAEEMHRGVAVRAGEPRDRSTVGRAYYSAYLAVREAVRVKYKNPQFDVNHSDLRDALVASTDPDVADVGGRLKTLFATRSRADYRLAATVSKNEAALMIANARAVLGKIPLITPKIPAGIPQKNP
jgi:uncharacterized protein (UPF0332 family)